MVVSGDNAPWVDTARVVVCYPKDSIFFLLSIFLVSICAKFFFEILFPVNFLTLH